MQGLCAERQAPVFLSNHEQILLLLFEIMVSQVCKPSGTLHR